MIFSLLLSLICFTDSAVVFAYEVDNNTLIDDVLEEDLRQKSKVHIGGFQVGFILDIDGVVVTGFNEVETQVGKSKLKSCLKEGDIIKFVNGNKIDDAEDITNALDNQIEPNTLIIYSRNGKSLVSYVEPLIERVGGNMRLGLKVRDDVGGIGTVTYVSQDGKFGALGHCVGNGIASSDIVGGIVYDCKINDIEKGRKGTAGSVIGSIDKSKKLGEINKCNEYGIYGRLYEYSGDLYETIRRNKIQTGEAILVNSLFGGKSEYDIEIMKTVYQPSNAEKGMVIRVLDKDLLALSGGIVQGMSGSPIVMNGKLIGAVTHVFINDPTRGYGIYIDVMLSQTAC